MNDERMLFKNNHSRRSLTIAANLVMIFMVLLFIVYSNVTRQYVVIISISLL